MRIRLSLFELSLLLIVIFLIVCCFQLKQEIKILDKNVSTILDQMVILAENQKEFSHDYYSFRDQFQIGTFKVSAYSPLDDRNGLSSWRGGKIMRTGAVTAENIDKGISVDPKVIPLGSKVWIQGIGWRTALDTGGAIRGNKLDIPMRSFNEAIRYGRQDVLVIYPRNFERR